MIPKKSTASLAHAAPNLTLRNQYCRRFQPRYISQDGSMAWKGFRDIADSQEA